MHMHMHNMGVGGHRPLPDILEANPSTRCKMQGALATLMTALQQLLGCQRIAIYRVGALHGMFMDPAQVSDQLRPAIAQVHKQPPSSAPSVM